MHFSRTAVSLRRLAIAIHHRFSSTPLFLGYQQGQGGYEKGSLWIIDGDGKKLAIFNGIFAHSRQYLNQVVCNFLKVPI